MTADLSSLLQELSRRHGEHRAVVGERATLSFCELDRAADAWANALHRSGYARGKHVGLLAGNGPVWLSIAFGVWRSGATLVPLSTFATQRELLELLAHADVDLLVAQP